jgi:hypothetical protein
MRSVRYGVAAAVAVAGMLAFAGSGALAAGQSGASDDAVGAKTWVGKAQEYEAYLKTAEIVKLEEVGLGVTHPRRAHLAPGGLFESLAGKQIRPGRYNGYWESYKSEIAAYEIDKLLGLDMVPPTVERRVEGELGAAVMWTSPVHSFHDMGGMPSPPPQYFDKWNREIVKAKMFDDLIGNSDPNLGNWLFDPEWNLILIDHSRALTSSKDRVHKLTRVDGELWDKMLALTPESLTAAAGQWLDGGAIKGIIARRDEMKKDVDKLIAKSGEAAVIMR